MLSTHHHNTQIDTHRDTHLRAVLPAYPSLYCLHHNAAHAYAYRHCCTRVCVVLRVLLLLLLLFFRTVRWFWEGEEPISKAPECQCFWLQMWGEISQLQERGKMGEAEPRIFCTFTIRVVRVKHVFIRCTYRVGQNHIYIYIYVRCMYGILNREITKYTVIYGAYIRFWPTLWIYGVCF